MPFIFFLIKHLFQWQKYNFFYNKQQILLKKCIFLLLDNKNCAVMYGKKIILYSNKIIIILTLALFTRLKITK